METTLSKPLTVLPSFMSAVSMVGDDQERTIRSLVHAERKSPPVYKPARELFIRVLQGDFTVQAALAQARRLHDETERKCAHDVLGVSETFLKDEPRARVVRLGAMRTHLPNRMELNVSPVWIRDSSQRRLLVLHFWQQPLSDWQRSAAAAILLSAMERDNPEYVLSDLDFISLAVPDHTTRRRLEIYGWDELKPLDDADLRRFLQRLCDAWAEYQRRGPRLIRRRHNPTLFEP